jgi:hypothetical protein
VRARAFGLAAALCACAPAAALCACAGPASEPAPPAPAAAPAAAEAAPLSPERRRFEEWKQRAEAGDPRGDFAHAAEAEMERRRAEAIARGAGAGTHAVEAEIIEDRLAELGAGGGGCFEEEPDWESQDDWIRHRALEREDFLEAEKSDDAKPVVKVPGGEIGAYVVVRLACIVKGRISEPEAGHFVVDIERVRYLALLSRQRSWWNPDTGWQSEWILRHEQLHFDVAELIAQELTQKAGELHAKLRGTGPDPHAAIEDFQRRWAEHIREQQARFEAIEKQYDRETRHGTDLPRQTEWFARVRRGLGAVRAGLDTSPVLIGSP